MALHQPNVSAAQRARCAAMRDHCGAGTVVHVVRSGNPVLRRVAAVAALIASFTTGVVLASDTDPRHAYATVALLEGTTSSWPDTLDHVLISTRGGGVDAGVVDALTAVDGVSARVVAPGVVAAATAGSRDDLWVDAVTAVGDDVLIHLAGDARQGEQWWLDNTGSAAQAAGNPGVADADIDGVEAHALGRGAGSVVAVIDSSFDTTHPDLAGQWWVNADEVCANSRDDDANGFVDDCAGWDFGGGDPDVRPDAAQSSANRSHGTHVSGLIAARADGQGIVGVAPEAAVMPLKVAQGDAISLSTLVGAVVYAADNGADVMNLSLGTSPGVPREALVPLEQAVAYAEARGVLMVAAAGNQGVNLDTSPVWPASYAGFHRNVIAVGASTNTDVRASFSNTGSVVGVVAPGFAMVSTVPGGYQYMSGTSMAAPLVAAAAALTFAAERLTPAAVRDLFVATSDAVAAGARLNAAQALGAVAAPTSVSYAGFDAVVADTPATVSVYPAFDVPPGSVLSMSVASIEAGEPMAVEGLAVAVSSAGTPTTATSAADGGLGAFPVAGADPVSLRFTVPAGDYAFVTQLVGPGGEPLTGLSVVSFTASPSTGGDQGQVSPSTSSPTVDTTSPSVPSPSAPGEASTTTVPAVVVTTLPGTSTTALPAPTTVPSPNTSAPPASTPPTSTAPVTSPVTAPGATPVTTPVAAPTTAPAANTVPAPSTPVVGPTVPGVTPSPTTAPATTAPTTATTNAPAAPSTTSTVPPPGSNERWTLTDMTPNSASTNGGTRVRFDGSFPTYVPVYVWFGEVPVPVATNDGATLEVISPAGVAPGRVSVSVRFETSSVYRLELAETFEFVAPAAGGSPTTTVAAPATTAPSPLPSSTTVPAPATPVPLPSTTAPPPADPLPSTTAPGGTPTTVPDTVASSAPAQTTVPGARSSVVRGALTLRAPAAGSPLAGLVASDVTPCALAVCHARPLP